MVSDNISSMLGAPPNNWKKGEVDQIKQIHRCYRNAFNRHENDEQEVDLADVANTDAFNVLFGNSAATAGKQVGTNPLTTNQTDFGKKKKQNKSSSDEKTEKTDKEPTEEDEADVANDREGKRDEEWYLPRDSPLRSKDGDKKAPANVTFKDYETFVQTCEFDHWRENFEGQAQDRFLAETAETIVANICGSQSRKELRVRHGSVPAGRYLRKKREHITPLALTLHELKLWATNILRTASIYEEDTYKELRCRIKYLEALSQKEVWGDPAGPLQPGMRAIAHDKLFRLLLTTKEALERAQEYAYRGYCRRSSREKLARLGNLIKNVILREMRILSAVLTLKDKLSNPKTPRLQPTDLFNKISNQSFVDYTNMVNVCMYELCQIPLVKASLTSDYDSSDVRASLDDLSNWTKQNLFCKPSEKGDEPLFLMDNSSEAKGMIPSVYSTTSARLKELLREVDPHAKIPLPAQKHVKQLKKSFNTDEAAISVVKMMMKCAAAIQDLIPGLYASYQLWGLAGDGGDFTVYDTLREQVIRVMSNTIDRVYAVQSTEKILLNKIATLAKEQEQLMEKKRLKTRKAEYKPAWISNYYFLRTDILPAAQKGYTDAYKQLWEIAKDAWEYNLTSEQLSDKVEAAKKMCDALTGGPQPQISGYQGYFKASDIIKVGNGKDWLKAKNTNIKDDNMDTKAIPDTPESDHEEGPPDDQDSDDGY